MATKPKTVARRRYLSEWRKENRAQDNDWQRKAKASRGKTLVRYGLKLIREAAVENVLKQEIT
jgi:hypothetical protein